MELIVLPQPDRVGEVLLVIKEHGERRIVGELRLEEPFRPWPIARRPGDDAILTAAALEAGEAAIQCIGSDARVLSALGMQADRPEPAGFSLAAYFRRIAGKAVRRGYRHIPFDRQRRTWAD